MINKIVMKMSHFGSERSLTLVLCMNPALKRNIFVPIRAFLVYQQFDQHKNVMYNQCLHLSQLDHY